MTVGKKKLYFYLVYTASIHSNSSLESNFLKQDKFNIRKTSLCSKFYIGLLDGEILDRALVLFTKSELHCGIFALL